MYGHDRGRTRQERWRKVGHVENVHTCFARCCWACKLFPYKFFYILVVRSKAWYGLNLVGKGGVTVVLLLYRLWPQQDIFILLVYTGKCGKQMTHILPTT